MNLCTTFCCVSVSIFQVERYIYNGISHCFSNMKLWSDEGRVKTRKLSWERRVSAAFTTLSLHLILTVLYSITCDDLMIFFCNSELPYKQRNYPTWHKTWVKKQTKVSVFTISLSYSMFSCHSSLQTSLVVHFCHQLSLSCCENVVSSPPAQIALPCAADGFVRSCENPALICHIACSEYIVETLRDRSCHGNWYWWTDWCPCTVISHTVQPYSALCSKKNW